MAAGWQWGVVFDLPALDVGTLAATTRVGVGLRGAFCDEGPEGGGSAAGDGEGLGPLVAALPGAADLAAGDVGARHHKHVAVAANEQLEDEGDDSGVVHW